MGEASPVGVRLLLVTFYFSPAQAQNAVRAVELANHVVGQDGSAHVLTLSEEDLVAVNPYDPDLAFALRPDVRVHRVDGGPLRRRLRGRSSDLGSVRRLKESPLAQLLVPDPYVDCISRAIRAGLVLAAKWRPTKVWSIGYPWSAHFVGAFLARRIGVGWVAENADPWACAPATLMPIGRWRGWLDKWLEARLLRAAETVVVTTRSTAELYRQRFPFLAERIALVRFGYRDSPGAKARVPSVHLPEDRRRWIVYAGRIYRKARSAGPLLRAFAALRREFGEALDSQLALRLVGEVDDDTTAHVRTLGLEGIVGCVPWVSTAALRGWLGEADVLLLLGNHGGVQVPSKLYEYIGTRKPILMLEEAGGDEAAEIIRAVDAGWVVPNSERAIVRFLSEYLQGQIRPPSYRGLVAPESFSLDAALARYWQILSAGGTSRSTPHSAPT